MEISIAVLIMCAVVVMLVLLIPVSIGVYVYRDAKERHMDAILWTLVAVLVPSFIGLIIYLIIRNNHANLSCPNCKSPVSSQYALCPFCGVHLKTACPSCGIPVDGDWKLCPKCGSDLSETHTGAVSPLEPKKDRKLLGIILAVVLIPIILFFVGLVFMSVGYQTSTEIMDIGSNMRLIN
jgi:RNA polymerase subunit RPABC4/transcription elongation factor Spt4